MKVSDGSREDRIREGANEVLKHWRAEFLEVLQKHVNDPDYDIQMAIYMTASYNFYLYLKQFVESKGGVTWTEK